MRAYLKTLTNYKIWMLLAVVAIPALTVGCRYEGEVDDDGIDVDGDLG